jgi:hypothetical protein
MITLTDAMSRYQSLSRDRQLRFLAQCGMNLTVAARETYEFQASGVVAPERLRRINEIQHRVLGHVIALLENSSQRYPDDAIVRIVLAASDTDPRVASMAAWAFQHALERVEVTAGA